MFQNLSLLQVGDKGKKKYFKHVLAKNKLTGVYLSAYLNVPT